MYKDRYVDFQPTLQQFNEAFSTLRGEIDKLSDMVKAEEEKNAQLKQESNQADIETLELLTSNESLKATLASLRKQQAGLKAECAALLAKNKAKQ